MLNIEQDENNRYLVFRLGTELYGTPLLGVREVVEYQQPKPVPNTVEHCLGVVNIRGEILGVLDLRKKLNHPFEAGSGLSMLVVSSEGGSIAAVVDRVQAVAEIPPGEIEKMPLVRTRFPIEYLMGIGKVDGVMVTLIDLKKVLKDEDFKSLSSLSAAA